jgi:hypothetical protein
MSCGATYPMHGSQYILTSKPSVLRALLVRPFPEGETSGSSLTSTLNISTIDVCEGDSYVQPLPFPERGDT